MSWIIYRKSRHHSGLEDKDECQSSLIRIVKLTNDMLDDNFHRP